MKIGSLLINLTSEEPIVLPTLMVAGIEREIEWATALRAGGAVLAVDGHSDTKGGTKEPQRVLIDFVDDLKAEQARLRSRV
jgi:hypothetical protein